MAIEGTLADKGRLIKGYEQLLAAYQGRDSGKGVPQFASEGGSIELDCEMFAWIHRLMMPMFREEMAKASPELKLYSCSEQMCKEALKLLRAV